MHQSAVGVGNEGGEGESRPYFVSLVLSTLDPSEKLRKIAAFRFFRNIVCIISDNSMEPPRRISPNILITGTPGVGKSTLCEQLAEMSGLTWIQVGKLAKESGCTQTTGPEDAYQCPVLDEEKILDEMEDMMAEGGKIVDYHGCDFFPERWFDIVFVLRTDNTKLYDRLTNRGYTGKKLSDNLECEIFQTILEEAQDSYRSEIVHELPSNTADEMENNVEKINDWIANWKQTQ